MKILSLDISTHAGWALLESTSHSGIQELKLLDYALKDASGPAPRIYPYSITSRAQKQGKELAALVLCHLPSLHSHDCEDIVVVEDTNLGKQRFSQRMLEQIHGFFLAELDVIFNWSEDTRHHRIKYISSSAWRSTLGPHGFAMTKDEKKNNSKLSKIKNSKDPTGPDKKTLGIKGKIGKKHQAVRYVNARWSKSFKIKDNDICDAICVGEAYSLGATISDGT